jgi:hypothetical protein
MNEATAAQESLPFWPAVAEIPSPADRDMMQSHTAGNRAGMRVAYLTNQYPAPSHSFIRREIIALEARGHTVLRYALNYRQDELVDERDLAEKAKTRHVLRQSPAAILSALTRIVFRNPLGMMRALDV